MLAMEAAAMTAEYKEEAAAADVTSSSQLLRLKQRTHEGG